MSYDHYRAACSCYDYEWMTSMRVVHRTLVGCVCSYTMPIRAIWELLPEPKDEGNRSHVASGGVV